MKQFKVYANINPLEPNMVVCVWSSNHWSSVCVRELRKMARKIGRNLKSQGYVVEYQEITTVTHKI